MSEIAYWAEDGTFLGVHRPDEDATGNVAALWRALRRLRRRVSPRPIIYCAFRRSLQPRQAYARRTATSSPADADDGAPAAAAALLALAGAR